MPNVCESICVCFLNVINFSLGDGESIKLYFIKNKLSNLKIQCQIYVTISKLGTTQLSRLYKGCGYPFRTPR